MFSMEDIFIDKFLCENFDDWVDLQLAIDSMGYTIREFTEELRQPWNRFISSSSGNVIVYISFKSKNPTSFDEWNW